MQFTQDTPSRTAQTIFWLAFVLAWLVLLGTRALIHPDEGRYAMLSLGMLQSGDWVTPRLNGLLYFEKPALQYWAGAIAFKLFGINEFAARFWPGLTGLLSILTVGVTARRLWGNGHHAALVMAGTTWIAANSHFLNLDTGLSFFLTVALCAFVVAQQDDARAPTIRHAMWLAWAAMAGATLSKGLIGLVIPAGSLFCYSLFCWDWRPWRRMHWLSGLLILLLLCAPWFVLVSLRNPDFARFFFIHEHFERFLTTVHGREAPFWYFLPVLLIGFMPWTSLLPRLIIDGMRRASSDGFQTGRFLLIWALFVFAFFSKSSSKLPSYILPMFPALALLLGQSLTNMRAVTLKKHLWVPLLLWAALACALPLTHFLPEDPGTPATAYTELATWLSIGGILFLLCGALAWRALSREKTLAAIMFLCAGSLGGVLCASQGHDAIGRLKSSKDLVAQIQTYVHPETEIFSINVYEQTFPFYLQRPVVLVNYEDEFAFGQRVEPTRSIASLDAFVARWKAAPEAMAMMQEETFNTLSQRGLPMKTVYRDIRRIVVVKQ
ncbi:phospholipid carrier-dependent glycosyltransferase [Propionivibrio dicarboxylicus]|uniref:4-amino-4-deoxy-L-arabinose transferase n=1 Tax=Propionivibrio dicarboxylicus TaxID=83767 RepID=A0A1G8MP95_9RHOO|nr:phospholipid carrier-dependent glycosyltransferase [Propionivibrio dicarboxylicus]SDI69744.1 4-amino-4-deoxy-L-arabinose transferase [Propionivibrio dicarboxylicus]